MQQDTIVISERTMGIIALSCLIASLVAGIGARIAMRIVAITAHMPLSFNIMNTLGILLNCITFGFFIGFILMMITAVLAASPKVGKYIPGSFGRGLAFSVLLLVLGLPLFVGVNADDFALGNPLLDKFLFGTLFVIYAFTLTLAEKSFDRLLPRKQPLSKTDIPASNS